MPLRGLCQRYGERLRVRSERIKLRSITSTDAQPMTVQSSRSDSREVRRARNPRPARVAGCTSCAAAQASTQHVRRSRHVAAVRELPAGDELDRMEPFYPLHALVCDDCFLVQLEEYVTPEHIFTEYAYFSSYSTVWVAHAKAYCEMITDAARPRRRQPRRRARQQRRLSAAALPAARRSRRSASSRPPTWRRRPSPRASRRSSNSSASRLARRSSPPTAEQADLIIGNNVLAQVPDLNDFVAGMAILLKPRRRHHARVPASGAADRRRTSSTRSTTSISRTSRC